MLADLATLSPAPVSGGALPVTIATLASHRGVTPRELRRPLSELKRRGAVRLEGDGAVALTSAGEAQAAAAAHRERLWRSALARQMDLPGDRVHLSTDDIERVLAPEVLVALEGDQTTGRTLGTGDESRATGLNPDGIGMTVSGLPAGGADR